jgi:hypothetical protein
MMDIVFFRYRDVPSFQMIGNFKEGYLVCEISVVFEVVMESSLAFPLFLLQLLLNPIY